MTIPYWRQHSAPPSATPARRADESLSVASNAIARLDYDASSQEMHVTFARGGTYTISGFPEIEAHRWSNADSPGKYFNQYVRGRY